MFGAFEIFQTFDEAKLLAHSTGTGFLGRHSNRIHWVLDVSLDTIYEIVFYGTRNWTRAQASPY